ncbi:caspase-2-like [Acanthaster planci]|uniref:Caspase-2-like n=1 Tax=Acanthaster planci TaxID=133434 RepID=A0A8B7YTI0_ACAPL|nr:caspase-2-like [Acanthaster planci]
MDETDKMRLRKNRKVLVENITPKEILDHLIQEGIFTPEICDEISRDTRQDQVRKILNELEKKGSNAFGAFCDSLRETRHYGYLVDALENTNIDEPDMAPPKHEENSASGEGDGTSKTHTTPTIQRMEYNIIGDKNLTMIGSNVTVHNQKPEN